MTNQDRESIRKIIEPHLALNHTAFWLDLLTSAAVGWTSFFFAAFLDPFSWQQLIAVIIACLLLYRAQIFIHEISHFRRSLGILEKAYNWLLGYPNKFPTYIYYPHSFHHSRVTFGTKADPEYLCFKGRNAAVVLLSPFVSSLVLPLLLTIRFALVPLFYPLMSENTKRKIFQRASTLVMNPGYVRPIKNQEEIKLMVREDLRCAAYTWGAVAFMALGILPLQTAMIWYAIMFFASAMNMVRSKLNHRYDQPYLLQDAEGQLRDSVTVDAGWWTEIWAPLSLAYHTVHHLAPNVPYHNLRQAHRDLLRGLGPKHTYAGTVVPNFRSAVRNLVNTCRS